MICYHGVFAACSTATARSRRATHLVVAQTEVPHIARSSGSGSAVHSPPPRTGASSPTAHKPERGLQVSSDAIAGVRAANATRARLTIPLWPAPPPPTVFTSSNVLSALSAPIRLIQMSYPRVADARPIGPDQGSRGGEAGGVGGDGCEATAGTDHASRDARRRAGRADWPCGGLRLPPAGDTLTW